MSLKSKSKEPEGAAIGSLPGYPAGMLRKPGEPSPLAPEGMMTMYNEMAWKVMVQGSIGKLRARMLNLADSVASDKEQRAAMKGLMKDFFNQAYYPLIRDLEAFMVDQNLLPEVVLKCGGTGSDELTQYEENHK